MSLLKIRAEMRDSSPFWLNRGDLGPGRQRFQDTQELTLETIASKRQLSNIFGNCTWLSQVLDNPPTAFF